jgi:thiosulfate dehydrogenase
VKLFLAGLLAGICLLLLVAYLFIATGSMPIATRGDPLPFERRIAQMALHAAIGHDEDLISPVPADEANLISGARIYRKQCAVCHGVPGVEATAIAKGMFPPPPQLFKKMGVTDDPVGETYWKVKNGIRLTGMPGFEESLNATELWQVTQLLKKAHELPAKVKGEL